MAILNLTKPVIVLRERVIPAKEKITIPAVTADGAELIHFIDYGASGVKEVVCKVRFIPLDIQQDITIWKDNAYDDAGQYTDIDLQARLVEALTESDFDASV